MPDPRKSWAETMRTVDSALSAHGAGGDLAFERDASAIAIVSCLGGMYDLLEVEEVRPSRGSSQSCRP